MEPAMEWLLAHADDPAIDAGHTIGSSSSAEAPPVVVPEPSTTSQEQSENAEGAEVKSFKCDECGKLLKNQDEMEYHAAKTDHSTFSESTEEKKPLTEEEKKAQLALLEERMKQKRKEREEREKVGHLEKHFCWFYMYFTCNDCVTFLVL